MGIDEIKIVARGPGLWTTYFISFLAKKVVACCLNTSFNQLTTQMLYDITFEVDKQRASGNIQRFINQAKHSVQRFFLCLFFNGATGVQIHSFILPHRSASPRSRDSKIKREKDIKTEEEEDQKKKEKVGVVQFHIIPLIWLFFSIHSLLLLSRSNLYLWKSFLQKRRQKRKQRPR